MKKVAVFLVEGFEPIEAVTVIDILQRGTVNVDVLSLTGDIIVNGANGVTLLADKVFAKNYLSDDNIDYAYDFDYDAVVLPGGPGTKNYLEDTQFLAGLKKFFDDGKLVCTICAGPTVLDKIGILNDKTFCCYPAVEESITNGILGSKDVEVDGNLITSKGVGTALDFSLTILKVLMGSKVSNEVAESVLAEKETTK